MGYSRPAACAHPCGGRVDDIAEGGAEEFGDPKELAQLFADELATQETTRAAYFAFRSACACRSRLRRCLAPARPAFERRTRHQLGRVRSGRDPGRLRVDRAPADLVRGRVALDPARAPIAEAARRSCRRARFARTADENRTWFRRRLDVRVFSVFAVDYHSTYPGWEVVAARRRRTRPHASACGCRLPMGDEPRPWNRQLPARGEHVRRLSRPPPATAAAVVLFSV